MNNVNLQYFGMFPFADMKFKIFYQLNRMSHLEKPFEHGLIPENMYEIFRKYSSWHSKYCYFDIANSFEALIFAVLKEMLNCEKKGQCRAPKLNLG